MANNAEASQAKCTKEVADSGGWHFYPCGKPAKYRVVYALEEYLCCGVHVRRFKNRYGAVITPLGQQDESAKP